MIVEVGESASATMTADDRCTCHLRRESNQSVRLEQRSEAVLPSAPRIRMEEKEITTNDLMTFLQQMSKTMSDNKETLEDKIDKTKEVIDSRLTNIDGEICSIKDRIEDNEDFNKRMEIRLTSLEREMKKSEKLKKNSDKLRETLRDQDLEALTPDREQGHEEDKDKDKEKKQEKTFRSAWAQQMEEELRKAAGEDLGKEKREGRARFDRNAGNEPGKGEKEKHCREERRTEEKEKEEDWRENEDIPSSWEELLQGDRRKEPKVRKPPREVKEWFGISTESEESEEDSDTGWKEVDRRKAKEEKEKKVRRKRKELQEDTAMRASCMVGLGPMDSYMMEDHRRRKMPIERSKIILAKNFLKYKLGMEDDETDDLEIMETKLSNKDERIINVAFKTPEQAKEVFIRKAEIGDDDIIVRKYIPPGFYERFKFLNGLCAGRRGEDPALKTQLRFGKRDIELFTKIKGEDAPYKQVRLVDFTDTTKIPPFDHTQKWKRYPDRWTRKYTPMRNPTETAEPAKEKNRNQNHVSRIPVVRRQISTEPARENFHDKRQKLNADSSEEDMNTDAETIATNANDEQDNLEASI